MTFVSILLPRFYGSQWFAVIACFLVLGTSARGQVLTFADAKQRADAGDAFSQAVVALHYQLGWNTEKNPELAARYATASANVGHPLGQFRLGALLRAGEGVPKDEAQGLAYQAASFEALYQAQDPYSITCAAIMIFQGKVVGQNVDKQRRQSDAAEMYKRAADMGYAPAQFNYAMVLKDGSGVRRNANLSKEYIEKAVALSYPFAVEFALERERKLQGAGKALAGSVVEGLNMAGQRWAYEFLDHTAHPTQTLAGDSAGLIVFADDRYVVRQAELQGAVDVGASTSKTELSFYDVKSGKLAGLVSVPNSVFKVGSLRLGEREVFYIGTITPGKYQFVDFPLALVLVDIESRKLERLPLIESDYWLALNNPVEIDGMDSKITIKVDAHATSEMGGLYLSNRPQTAAFADIQVVLLGGAEREKDSDHFGKSLQQHRILTEADTSALAYLGQVATSAKDPSVSRGEFVVSADDSSPARLRLLRAESVLPQTE